MTINKKWIETVKLHKLTRVAAGCMLALSVSMPVWALDDQEDNAQNTAAEGESNLLEEVIVTSARRRDENIQDVPIAVVCCQTSFLKTII